MRSFTGTTLTQCYFCSLCKKCAFSLISHWNQEMFDAICSLKPAKVVDDSWGHKLNISNMLTFISFFEFFGQKWLKNQKINDINVAVFIWFAATPAAPIAPYTCATSNSPRFPLLPFWKFLALTHGIWHSQHILLIAANSTALCLNIVRLGRVLPYIHDWKVVKSIKWMIDWMKVVCQK